jgi:hypothetical protein
MTQVFLALRLALSKGKQVFPLDSANIPLFCNRKRHNYSCGHNTKAPAKSTGTTYAHHGVRLCYKPAIEKDLLHQLPVAYSLRSFVSKA